LELRRHAAGTACSTRFRPSGDIGPPLLPELSSGQAWLADDMSHRRCPFLGPLAPQWGPIAFPSPHVRKDHLAMTTPSPLPSHDPQTNRPSQQPDDRTWTVANPSDRRRAVIVSGVAPRP